MNYVVVYKKDGTPAMEFFHYRDETDVVFSPNTLIRDEDDVISVMREYYLPDNDEFIIRETMLDVPSLGDREILLLLADLYSILNDK